MAVEFKSVYGGGTVSVDPANVDSVMEDAWVVGRIPNTEIVETARLRMKVGREQIVFDRDRSAATKIKDAGGDPKVIPYGAVLVGG